MSLSNVGELLLSASRVCPLVTIHREQIDPTVCWIGRVIAIDGDRVAILQLGPDAAWHGRPTEYGLRKITRVNFGGDYEGALALVSGARVQAKRG